MFDLFLGGAHVNFLLNGHQSTAVDYPDAISVHLHLLMKSFTQCMRAAQQDVMARQKAEVPVDGRWPDKRQEAT